MSLQAYLVFPQETFGKTIRLVLLKADYIAASEEKMKGVKKPRKQLFIDVCDEQKWHHIAERKVRKTASPSF